MHRSAPRAADIVAVQKAGWIIAITNAPVARA